MDDQPTLFTMPVEAVMMQAHWEYPHGWVAVLRWRRAGQTWEGAERRFYDSLSSPELSDVLSAELARTLGG